MGPRSTGYGSESVRSTGDWLRCRTRRLLREGTGAVRCFCSASPFWRSRSGSMPPRTSGRRMMRLSRSGWTPRHPQGERRRPRARHPRRKLRNRLRGRALLRAHVVDRGDSARIRWPARRPCPTSISPSKGTLRRHPAFRRSSPTSRRTRSRSRVASPPTGSRCCGRGTWPGPSRCSEVRWPWTRGMTRLYMIFALVWRRPVYVASSLFSSRAGVRRRGGFARISPRYGRRADRWTCSSPVPARSREREALRHRQTLPLPCAHEDPLQAHPPEGPCGGRARPRPARPPAGAHARPGGDAKTPAPRAGRRRLRLDGGTEARGGPGRAAAAGRPPRSGRPARAS